MPTDTKRTGRRQHEACNTVNKASARVGPRRVLTGELGEQAQANYKLLIVC